MKSKPSVIIIGGGAIGLAAAYALGKQGVGCIVLDKGPAGAEATSAAAGMLGAQVETHEPGPMFELCRLSRSLYPVWSEELYELTGVSPQYINRGIVRAALTGEDEQELRGRLPWISGGDEAAVWLEGSELLALEPALSRHIRGGLYFPDDHQVHPVHLARALRAAAIRVGCRLVEHTSALRLIVRSGAVVGVVTPDGELTADRVVVAAGAWTASLLNGVGLHLPVVPVKGQCYSLRTDAPPIRHTVFVKGCYIVPKLDGTLLIGATQEEAGFDKSAPLSAVTRLHEAASALVPSLSRGELVSTWAGLRPGTPDGLPYMGEVDGLPGLILASGHFRNGILLAPVAGSIVSDLVMGRRPSVELAPFSPGRALQPVMSEI